MRSLIFILTIVTIGCFSSCRKDAVMRNADFEGIWWKYSEDCRCWYFIEIESSGYASATSNCNGKFKGKTKTTKTKLKIGSTKFIVKEWPTAITSIEQGCFGEIAVWRMELETKDWKYYSGVYYKNE